MVTLSAAIMAHPVRAGMVDDLLAELDRPVPVAWDPNGPPSPEPWRRWTTGRLAWESIDPAADWGIVLQDDIHVSGDFLAGLERALEHVPDEAVVQPYVGTKRPDPLRVAALASRAVEVAASWITMRGMQWGPAICVPTRSIPAMLDWCSDEARRDFAYDKRIGVHYRDIMRWRTWYTWPSLVQHRLGRSIIGHSPNRGLTDDRQAHGFWQGSALDLDWSGPVVSDQTPTTAVKPLGGNVVGVRHDPYRPHRVPAIRPHRVPATTPAPKVPVVADSAEAGRKAGEAFLENVADDKAVATVEKPAPRDTVAAWRTYLEALGLDTSGTKKELIARAAEHEA